MDSKQKLKVLISSEKESSLLLVLLEKGTERKERKPGTDPETKVEMLGSLKTLNVTSSNIVTGHRNKSAWKQFVRVYHSDTVTSLVWPDVLLSSSTAPRLKSPSKRRDVELPPPPSISSAFRSSNLPRRWQMNGEKMSNQMKNKYFTLRIQRGERLRSGSRSRHNLLPFHLASLSCGKQNSSLILHSVCFYIFINYLPDHQRRLFTLLPASYFTSVTLHLRRFHLPETPPPPPHLRNFSVQQRSLRKPSHSSPLLTTVFKFFS